MKYARLLVVLMSAVSALSEPWLAHSDSYAPLYLEKRMTGGGGPNSKPKLASGKVRDVEKFQPSGSSRSDSPPRPDDTRVSVKAIGPGWIATQGTRGLGTQHSIEEVQLGQGERVTKEAHDVHWNKASGFTNGRTAGNANRQSALLDPLKIEGTGRSGKVEVHAAQGGHGQLKKIVNGQVVRDERVRPGQTGIDEHRGSRPGEVTYKTSASRGGELFVNVNNHGTLSSQPEDS